MNAQVHDLSPVLARVRAAGIDLWVSNGQLHFRAPPGALTGEVRDLLRERKVELIGCLAGPQFRRRECAGPQRALRFYDGLWDKIRSGALGVNFTNGTHWAAAVEGPLDLSALRASVDQLVRRHQILGARLRTEGEPHFEFDREVPLHTLDVSTAAADAAGVAAARDAAVDDLLWRGFAADEPFLRVFAVTQGHDRHVIGFVVNHYVADLASVHVIAGELIAGYEGQAGSEPALQYADYVTALNAWLDTPALDYRLAYWQRGLAGAAPSRLKPALAAGEADLGHERYEGFRIEPQILQRLQAFAPAAGVTLFDTLLAAKACALRFALDQSDIAVLSMHHGRDDPILQGLVGSTQNQMVLRLRLEDDMTLADLARAAHAATLEAYRHQVPYHYVRGLLPQIGASAFLAELNVVDRSSGARTAPAGAFVGSLRPQGIRWPVARNRPAGMPSHFLKVEINPAGITGGMGYLDTLFTQAQIRAFLDDFRAQVTRMAENPEQRLGDRHR
jgi:hypothetical protein